MKEILLLLTVLVLGADGAEARKRGTQRTEKLRREGGLERRLERSGDARREVERIVDREPQEQETVEVPVSAGLPLTETTTAPPPADDAPASQTAPSGGWTPANAGSDAGSTPASAPQRVPLNSELPSLRFARNLPAGTPREGHLVLVFNGEAGHCQWIHNDSHLTAGSRECRQGDAGWELRADGGESLQCHTEWNVASAYLHQTMDQYLSQHPNCRGYLEHMNPGDPNYRHYQIADRDGDGTLCFEAGIGCAYLVGPSQSQDPTAPADGSLRMTQVLVPDIYGRGPATCQWVPEGRSQGFAPCTPQDAGYTAGIDSSFCCAQRDFYTFTGPWLGSGSPLDFRYFLRDNPSCRMDRVDYSKCGCQPGSQEPRCRG